MERELRDHAGRNLPGSKRELACFLYLTAAENSPQAQEAYKLMRSAAEAGDSAAQFDMGNRYLAGDGVVADEFEAARWFRLAAEQDWAAARRGQAADEPVNDDR